MSAVRYGGWAKDTTGWLFGLTAGTWSAVLVAGAPTFLAMAGGRWTTAMVCAPLWVVLTVTIAVPLHGRSTAGWLVAAALKGMGDFMGWTSWRSRTLRDPGGPSVQAELPGVLAGIRVFDGPPLGPLQARPAVVQDLAARTWALVARVSHHGIGLVEAETRHRMAAGLGDLLESSAAAEQLSVLALQVRTVPDDGAERTAWQQRYAHPDAPALAIQVTAELDAAVTARGVQHEVFVTIVVPEHRVARQARDAGGGVDGRARVLYGVAAEIQAGLLGAIGASGVTWLDSGEIAEVLRTAYAPDERHGLIGAAAGQDLDASTATGVPLPVAGPVLAPTPARRHYEHDAWSTVSSAVLLPDRGAVMGALAPVLMPADAGERRCFTVLFEPLARGRAERLVGREAMSATTGSELRSRAGFSTRAAHRRDAARVASQDVSLAEGRSLVRVAAAAAVTVPSTWSIADAGRRLEASIRTAGFVPLRLDLAQDAGFAVACVPLGIGLSRGRGTW